ncbi:MAG: hypothetical protein HYX73_02205 [Acidobacteria bacterium]|nr:hypothetical protein [Acidobacteriota bacterium]
MADSELARLQDPMGVSGYIEPCLTDAQLEDAKSKLLTAADKAREFEEKGNTKDAFGWWSLLYDGKFPGYYY